MGRVIGLVALIVIGLVVAATLEEAEGLTADLATLLPGDTVLLFPEQEILPYDKKSPYKGLVGQQVEVEVEGLGQGFHALEFFQQQLIRAKGGGDRQGPAALGELGHRMVLFLAKKPE